MVPTLLVVTGCQLPGPGGPGPGGILRLPYESRRVLVTTPRTPIKPESRVRNAALQTQSPSFAPGPGCLPEFNGSALTYREATKVPPVTAAPKIRTLQRELCQDLVWLNESIRLVLGWDVGFCDSRVFIAELRFLGLVTVSLDSHKSC